MAWREWWRPGPHRPPAPSTEIPADSDVKGGELVCSL